MFLKQALQRVIVLAFFVMLMSFAYTGIAQESADHPAIVVTADGVTVPEDLTAGIVTLTFQNDTETEFSPILFRFKEGYALPDLMGAMQSGDAKAALETVVAIGSPSIAAESAVNVTYNLVAGDHILLSFAVAGPPTIANFSVAEADTDTEAVEVPEGDIIVDLLDFSFGIQGQPSGKQVWRINNIGEQPHEMVIFRVDDDATIEGVTEQFMEAMMSAEGGPPEMPFEQVFFWNAMSPENTAWVDVELEAGMYVVVCFVLDLNAEESVSHLHRGMISLITIEE